MNECNLSLSQPALEAFFSGDSIADVLEFFEINETMNSGFAGASGCRFMLVFPEAPPDVVRHTDVQNLDLLAMT